MPWLLPKRRGTGSPPLASRKAKATLPRELPGSFFVLAWDRNREVFVLLVDDRDGSNYNLGGDIQVAMTHFEAWGHKDIGCRALDAAYEFGMVQAIPAENRVIQLTEPPDRAGVVVERLRALEEQEPGNVCHLPTLRSSL